MCRGLRETCGDELVIDDRGAGDDAVEQARVEVGLFKTREETRAHLGMAGGEKFVGMLELAGVGGVGGKQGIDVAGVVGVELALDDGGGGEQRRDDKAFHEAWGVHETSEFRRSSHHSVRMRLGTQHSQASEG